jgi:serine O-acetyltransferase
MQHPQVEGSLSVKTLLMADLYRSSGTTTARSLFKLIVRGETYRYNVAVRFARSLSFRRDLLGRLLFFASRVWVARLRRSRGINLPWETEVGPGLFIGHCGGIVVTPYARIGRDCNLSHNVTIGVTRGGRHPGAPTIGDRVYIGPGAVLIGAITIGNDVAIGANAVVTHDVPDRATVRGNPGVIVEGRGSSAYVNRTTELIAPPIRPSQVAERA